MNLTKCPNNHLYNADHFPTCPYCSNIASSLSPEQLTGENESDINTSPVERTIDDMNNNDHNLIVGWLVCINGDEYGQYFPLYSGTNAIGRGSNMDICIKNDMEISRLVHAEICYDSIDNKYTLDTKSDANPVYVNDKLIHTDLDKSYILHDRDKLPLGAHTFMIIELCNDDFSWR